MLSPPPYRFYILNGCDPTESFECTAAAAVPFGSLINENTFTFEIAGHTFVEGDLAYFSGFPFFINGYKEILGASGDLIFIKGNYITSITYPTQNTMLAASLGTIARPRKRYVNPYNFLTAKFVWERDRDSVRFRKRLSDKILFKNGSSKNESDKDFTYLKDNVLANPCCEIKFVIEKYCTSPLDTGLGSVDTEDDLELFLDGGGIYVNEWEGFFTANMGEWDLSRCLFIVQPEVDDLYRCIDYGKKKKINVLTLAAQSTFTIIQDVEIEEIECCDENVTVTQLYNRTTPEDPDRCPDIELDGLNNGSFFGSIGAEFGSGQQLFGMAMCEPPYVGSLIQVTIENFEIVFPNPNTHPENVNLNGSTVCRKYQREVLVTFDNGGDPQEPPQGDGNEWFEGESVIIGGYPARKWYRARKRTVPDPIENDWMEYEWFQSETPCDIPNFNNCCSLNVTFPYGFEEYDVISYSTGRRVSDVLQALAGASCQKIKGIRSDFLEINPVGDTPDWVAGTNYVTGEANVLKNLLLIQMSDFLDPLADEPASIGELSFEEFLNGICLMFNADWFIDDMGFIRIEHVSWFSRDVVADVTTKPYRNYSRNKNNNHFTYDREKMPLFEKYNMPIQATIDFFGSRIEYNSPCTDIEPVEYAVERISTDVSFIPEHGDKVDLTDWVMVALDPDDLTTLDKEVGRMSGINKNNAHLSWANLHYNYHRYNRWVDSGLMNGNQETFLSTRRTKRQKDVTYIGECCIDINPVKHLINTEIGEGEIDKMVKTLKDEMFTFELLFGASGEGEIIVPIP